MQPDQAASVKFEIGHVLFIDIVGYSKLLIHQQSEQLETLKQIVRGTEQFRLADAEGKLLRLPTGDGGALVFRNSVEAPVLCAMEISKALRNHPTLRVRMGIHSGPVNAITDLNEQANIAGAGINIAQRVMDCGDAGHILLSRHVAEDLEQYGQWQPHLHDLGECEVKHNVRVHIFNLSAGDVGNPELPEKFKGTSNKERTPTAERSGKRAFPLVPMVGAALLLIAAIVLGAFLWSRHSPTDTAPASAAEKSIAVLPFQNLSDEKANAYFADGIQDEILTRLSKIAALKVISRTSTQKYKSAPDNLRDIGRQLGVANILEGSVQKIANAVHVNVQLIRAANDEHLWAESYNRKLDDVFGVEGEIATAIAEQLDARLTGAEQKAVSDKPTQNAAAYDAYLRGISIEETRTDDAAQGEAIRNYSEAVRFDLKFALAWARLAVLQSVRYFDGDTNAAASVKEAADHALALQPQLGEAFVAQGVYRYRVLRDFRAALESYKEALKRLPNSSLVLQEMAHVERRLGDWDAAEKHYRAAVELDPRNVTSLSGLADFLGLCRHFPEAQATWDRILQISPGDEVAIASKALNFQAEGRLEDSARELSKISGNSPNVIAALAKALQLGYERRFDDAVAFIRQSASTDFKTDPRAITTIAWWEKWAGRKDAARATFQQVVAAIKPTPGAVVPVDSRTLGCFLAWAYAGLGEQQAALEEAKRAVADYRGDILAYPFAEQWLAAVEAQCGDLDSAMAILPHLLEVPAGLTRGQLRIDPVWDPLRNDPRFQKLITEAQPK
jgi:TolB-like protein/class 3 adenylate cyclase/Tfp pilus assembly protein PilF